MTGARYRMNKQDNTSLLPDNTEQNVAQKEPVQLIISMRHLIITIRCALYTKNNSASNCSLHGLL